MKVKEVVGFRLVADDIKAEKRIVIHYRVTEGKFTSDDYVIHKADDVKSLLAILNKEMKEDK